MDFGGFAAGAEGPKCLSALHLRTKVYALRTKIGHHLRSRIGYNKGMKTETIYKSEAYPQVKNTQEFRDFIMWGCDGVKGQGKARWKFFDPIEIALHGSYTHPLNDGIEEMKVGVGFLYTFE